SYPEVTMQQSSCPRPCWAFSGVLVGLMVLFALTAAAQVPHIEGTYKRIARKLPDGTVPKPPEVMGLCTYTKTHRNFTIIRQDATGKFASFSLVSTYTLTATEYSETALFSIRTAQIGGKDVVYDLTGLTRSVPVTVAGGRIQFALP